MRILYAAQTGVAPPTFVFFTNVATSFHFSYERFLENRLREEFGFEGTPIRLQVRRRDERGEVPEATAVAGEGQRVVGSEGGRSARREGRRARGSRSVRTNR